VLRGSYEAISNDQPDSHPAIMLVSAYIVERGLILEPYEVNSKTNEITALPALNRWRLRVVFAFDAISTKPYRPLLTVATITWEHSKATNWFAQGG